MLDEALGELVCPTCRTVLEQRSNTLCCRACGRRFPVVAGIPDLRVTGDRYLSLEADRAKAEGLAGVRGGFADVVAAYWEQTPEVPPELARRYAARMVDGARRAAVHLDHLGEMTGRLLDVGCGTGGLVAAAAARGVRPVGVDIALRWLVVAQRGLREAGVDAALVAADGALLPFPRVSFDVVTCVETLEHAHDQRGLLHGCLGVAGPEGRVYMVTANRFSLLPDPTVRLWGLGFLPRRAAVSYVRRRRRTRYHHMRPLSVIELRSFLGPHPSASIGPARIPPPPPGASRARQALQTPYEWLTRQRRCSRLLTAVGPYLQVVQEPHVRRADVNNPDARRGTGVRS